MIPPVVASAFARLVTFYVDACLRTSRFEIPKEAAETLARTWDDGEPTVYVYWHDEFVMNVLLPLYWKSAAVREEMPVCAANDAFGGAVIKACLDRLGVPLAMLPRRKPRADKLATLTAAIREHRRMLLAADYGAPWFNARPTAWHIARDVVARVVAMHIHASRDLTLARGTWKLRLPLPFSFYELRLDLLDEAHALDDDTLASALTTSLDALREGGV